MAGHHHYGALLTGRGRPWLGFTQPGSNFPMCYGPESRNRTLAWRSAWQDRELTAQAQEAVAEGDASRRLRLYEQLQREHMERSPFAIMLQQTDTAVLRPGVSGFEVAPAGRPIRYAGIRKA